MKTAFNASSVIGLYGTPQFKKETTWDDLKRDIDLLESVCQKVLVKVGSGNLIVKNGKRVKL